MGKGIGILGKKTKFSKNEGGEEYQSAGNFIHLWNITWKKGNFKKNVNSKAAREKYQVVGN